MITHRGTVTLLFTDQVGSTEFMQAVGDETADELRRIHYRLLRQAVATAGGKEVKNMGDGLMAVFTSAIDALSAAVGVQQAVVHQNLRSTHRLEVRIGLNVGEAIEEEEDYFGTPVVIAKRLCDSAAGGQILATELVRELVGTRGDFTFRQLKPRVLKGLGRKTALCEVVWKPAPERTISMAPALVQSSQSVFVGRDKQLTRLRGNWDQVLEGQHQVVLLAGEPGIGKTRLAAELAQEVYDAGATVLYGRCDEENLTPYQPFVQALHSYVLGSPEWELRAAVAASGSELSRIVPRLSQRIPGLSMPPPLGAEEARFRLFDSITLFLQEVAGSRPLLLILDDLHWADQPSLLLFQFIARELREGRVLILGTYRDIEVAQGHPLAETLTVLRREKLFESIPIAGLSATEVTQLLEHFSLRELDSRDRNLAAALHEQTEGNALFLQEILRDLVQSGQISSTSGGNGHRLTSLRDLAIPEGVMDIISRRLSRLSADCNQALSVAAVIGRDFGLNVLQRLARLSEERLLEVMDEAVAVRVADEGSGGIGRYSFSHALIREALYGGLSSARRARAHAGIVEVLEEMSIDHPHAYLSELSFHSIHAGSLLDPNKAILYGKRAGDGAMEVFAYEEAMDHYRGAVEALRNITPVAEVRLSELLLSLGDASRRAGHIDSAKATFREVAELAKARGAAEQQARAALGYGAALPTVANTDEVLIGLLEEALGLLPDQDSPLRAMVLARLASELSWRKQPERQAALSIGALEMARRLGDTKAMNTAVSALRLAQWSPDNLDQRLESSTEMAALAAQSADREIEITARLWRMSDLFEAGEAEAADVEMNICIPLAQEFQHPFYLWRAEIMRAMRAVTRGHFQEALRIGTEARAAGDRSDPDTAAALYMTLVYGVYRELGRLAEVEAPWARLAVKVPAPVLAIGQGQVYLQGGKPDQALEVYQRFRGNDFQDIPRDVYWLTAIALVAELSVEFEDGDGQAIIADLLRPHAHQCIIVGTRASLWWGSIAHYLGQVLTPMGELDEADTAFQTASVVHERFGAAPLLARTNLEHARMLVARAGNGDREDAKRLLSEVVPVADELGMSLVLRDARELSASTV